MEPWKLVTDTVCILNHSDFETAMRTYQFLKLEAGTET